MPSLRVKSIQAYRHLYRAAGQCGLSEPSELQRYLAQRFHAVAETHHRRLSTALSELASEMSATRHMDTPACYGMTRSVHTEEAASGKAAHVLHTRSTASTASVRHQFHHRRQQLLRKYERFVSRRIDDTHQLAQMLPRSAERGDLAAMLNALAGGVGNTAYRRAVEHGFAALVAFAAQREARNEATEEATSERQNRIMQHALLPYCERLLLLHRTAIGAHNRGSQLLYLTPWQVTEAIVGTRSQVVAHHVRHGHEHLVVEVDEGLNKQVIYVCRCRGPDMDSGSYEWQQPVERVEVSVSEEVPRTIFHAEFLHTATRLCDALMHETRIHRSRKTVLVGHGVGGAVAVIMALLLLQRGFSLANVITLGAPKALQSTQSRFVAAINPVRVVLSGDPLIDLPVTGSEGEPLTHIGEILLLTPHTVYRADPSSREHRMHLHGTHCTDYEDDAAANKDGAEDRPNSTVFGQGDKNDHTKAGGEDASTMQDEMTRTNRYHTHSSFIDTNEYSSGSEEDRDVPREQEECAHASAHGADTLDTTPDCANTNSMDDVGGRAVNVQSDVTESCDAMRAGDRRSDKDSDEEQDDETDCWATMFREAEQRYSHQFLIENYVHHLSDSAVELTYAEGDEVWDEGDYHGSRRGDAASVTPISSEDQRRRDLQGPL